MESLSQIAVRYAETDRMGVIHQVQVQEREVAAGSSLHALVDSQMKPVNPRNFNDLYQELLKVFPRP